MSHTIKAGRLEFLVEQRDIGKDGGASVRVFGDVSGKRTQVLRFDCFRNDPHYHYAPDEHDVLMHLDPVTTGDPIAWTLERLRDFLPTMLHKASYDDLASSLDEPALRAALPKLEAAMREPAAVRSLG